MKASSTAFLPLPAAPSDQQLLRLRCDSQSMSFYGDISQFLSRQIREFSTHSLLDVGSRTGAGLAMLRLMHHPASFSRLKFDPVVGIDMDPSFEFTAFREFPDIGALTGDIFNLSNKSWDIVLCSHTIEHIADAERFVEQLCRIARRYVVIACPFAENPLSDDHVRTIDLAFFHRVGFRQVEVYESHHFHGGVCCLAIKIVE